MNDDRLENLLKEEYFHIQSIINQFDQRALTIKAWSISFSLGAIGAGFAAQANFIFLIAAVSAFIFWVIETQWKTFQYAFYERARKIEAYFKDPSLAIQPVQLGSSWDHNWRKGGTARFLRIFSWSHVALPHLLAVLLGLGIFIWQW